MIPIAASSSSQTLSSAMLGIASIILEGRAISEDDFILYDNPYNGVQHFHRLKKKLEQLRQSSPCPNQDSLGSTHMETNDINTSLDDLPILKNMFRNPTTNLMKPLSEDNQLLSLQSLVTTTLCSTPRSVVDTRFWENSRQYTNSNYMTRGSVLDSTANFSDLKSNLYKKSAPKQGPHCEQFLKKLGIHSNIECNIECEEHICDTSVVNEICYHWRIHCLEIDTIISRNDPICIEVYLGPESDAILLEQWIIQYNNKNENRQMNLSSLCTAIRSQLYFSQITAWSDSIKNSDNHSIYDTGRFQFYNEESTSSRRRKPRLDIFYRIKSYEYSSISHFKSKPIVHNFPCVVINNNYSLSVSLKSLPRMHSIPVLNLNKQPFLYSLSSIKVTKADDENPDSSQSEDFYEKKIYGDENEDFQNSDFNSNVTLTHREKQVMRYKRLIKKRDICKRKSETLDCSEQRQLKMPELGSINSIRPPLYQTISSTISEAVQTSCVEMISVGTQTVYNEEENFCDNCGSTKPNLCLNCFDISKKEFSTLNRLRKSADKSKDHIDKAELLLSAIQRTPNNKKKCLKDNRGHRLSPSQQDCREKGDCILCKRQKTQKLHLNSLFNNNSFSNYNEFVTIENCQHSTEDSENGFNTNSYFYPSPNTQFKTPKNQITLSPAKTNRSKCNSDTKKNTDLNYENNFVSHNKKILPKVNLTELFCNPGMNLNLLSVCSSLPSKISSFDYSCEKPVQKSNSAPSLPSTSSPTCLSPRFIKQSITYQFRRSRHLSERSDRSSIGSDEQLSEDEIDFLCNSNGDFKIGRNGGSLYKSCRPFLGNLEESILQKRISPSKYVSGFKMLLGASGGFCPPQMTIPAICYFYEINGDTINTPYMCEIRIPKRGYKIPLNGNIQATILNPEGTVVRMFVISYDLRDMPPLHQTFIRQRIIAGNDKETNSDEAYNKNFMKFLRYSIHLRFQTSKSGRLTLHTDVRAIISRKVDCDTAAAHAKGDLEPKELKILTVIPENPRYSTRLENSNKRYSS